MKKVFQPVALLEIFPPLFNLIWVRGGRLSCPSPSRFKPGNSQTVVSQKTKQNRAALTTLVDVFRSFDLKTPQLSRRQPGETDRAVNFISKPDRPADPEMAPTQTAGVLVDHAARAAKACASSVGCILSSIIKQPHNHGVGANQKAAEGCAKVLFSRHWLPNRPPPKPPPPPPPSIRCSAR